MPLHHILLAWLFVLFSVLTGLLVHFDSSLTRELFGLLRRVGWRKQHPMWAGAKVEAMLQSEFVTWLSLCCVSGWLPALLVKIITCPICLSVHLSFWLAVVVGCATAAWAESWPVLLFVLACPLTVPWVAMRLRTGPPVTHHPERK